MELYYIKWSGSLFKQSGSALLKLTRRLTFKGVLLWIWKLLLTGHLPTHSLSVICLATVLWTRKGSPEPLPEVQEWSNRSWEKEIQKQKVKSTFTCVFMWVSVFVLFEWKPPSMESRWSLKTDGGACGTQMTNTSRLPLMWNPRVFGGGGECVQDNVACEWVCVCAGGADCPLLSKQQKCHPLLGGWCGHVGDFI